MATWTKIPETQIAGTLGKAVGGLFGSISTSVGDTLNGVVSGIDTLRKSRTELEREVQTLLIEKSTEYSGELAQGKVDEFLQKAFQNLAKYEAALDAATKSLNSILQILGTIKTVVQTLKVPLPALKAVITVIKALPLPQRYLVVSFTILESDLLEMLEQLIKQAEEEIVSLESIVESLESLIEPLKDRIERVRAQIALLKVSCNLTDISSEDREILGNAGLFDQESGDSLFEKIQDGLEGKGAITGYGTNPDLTNLELYNKLHLAEEGDVVTLETKPSGSFIETWFCCSEEQPTLPEGFPQVTGSWTQDPFCNVDNLWKVDLIVTGKGTIFGGLDSIPVLANEEDLRIVDRVAGLESYLILGEENYNQKPGILKIDNWEALLDRVFEQLRDLPLSQNLKERLVGSWNREATKARNNNSKATVGDLKFQWTSKLGETYTIEVVEDEHSPKVAVRRYVKVTDSEGVIVLTGLKTFSTDTDSLLQEIKIQLEHLTR